MAGGFRGLRAGQSVRVEELGWGCRLVVLEPPQPGHVIVAAEPEYVVLAGGEGTVRIPAYLIHEVVSPAEDEPEAA